MCGITGMLGNPDPGIVKSMMSYLTHRGPDGTGVWFDEEVALGHNRLAIVDLAGGSQPLISDDGVILIANGEIYNHKAIKSETRYNYKTSSDSEAIIALYNQHKTTIGSLDARGQSTWISKLDGMFAFAIWDPANNILTLARDAMGIKPLSRTIIDGSMLFSSEYKAFRAHESHIPKLDRLALAARIAWEYPLDSTTLLEGVTQVRPGSVEVWSLDKFGKATLESKSRFEQQIVQPAQSWDPDLQAPELLESFTYSVEQRLMADVPVGIVLSGGLDSSLVAAVSHDAANRAGQPVPECWTVAESEENPDWKAAEVVASSLDLKHHQHILAEDDFDNRLPDLVWHGEDLDTTVMFFQPLFEKMSQHVTVGLCGQGADELHAGYPRYRDVKAHSQLVNSRLESMSAPEAKMVREGTISRDDKWYKSSHYGEENCSDLRTMLEFELEHGQLSNFQLRLVDRHSMAHSLEVRVPFLGKNHRSLSSSLPMEWRLPSDTMYEKKALRAAADLTKLPEEIVRRPKLPAGRATSPSLLAGILNQLDQFKPAILEKYSDFSGGLKGQDDVVIGLGLFDAIHLNNRGASKPSKSAFDLLSEVFA